MVEEGIATAVGGGVLYATARKLRERHQRRRLRLGRDATLSGTLHGPGIPMYSLTTKIVISTLAITGVEQIIGGGGARYEVNRSAIRNVKFGATPPGDDLAQALFANVLTFDTDAGSFTLHYDPLWDRVLRTALRLG